MARSASKCKQCRQCIKCKQCKQNVNNVNSGISGWGVHFVHLCFVLAMPRGSWELSSPTRDGIQAIKCQILTTRPPRNSLGSGVFTDFVL